MGIILIITSLVLFCVTLFLAIQINKRKINLEQQEKRKEQTQKYLNLLQQEYEKQKKDLQALNHLIDGQVKHLESVNEKVKTQQSVFQAVLNNTENLREKYNSFQTQEKDKIKERLEEFKKTSSKAAENYFDELEKAYEHADAAHMEKIARLKTEQSKAAADLNKLQETRKAAHEAVLREKEIKENKDNYRLLPSSQDLDDIHSLERVKAGLHKPRILSMLIWQTYYQPIAKKQFPVILKDKTKMGIYKITNIQTDESYIGQSVDIYKRWSQHCKAGLGIDAPVGNKLYKAMQEYGLQNFTFELLCECSKEQLDEKEKYFIELYQANLYGYNGTKGNK